jgi:putative aldouronate transport system substrate-binding protein
MPADMRGEWNGSRVTVRPLGRAVGPRVRKGTGMAKKLCVSALALLLAASLFAASQREAAAVGGSQAEPQVVKLSYMYANADTAKYPTNADRPYIQVVLEIARARFGIDWQLEPVMSSQMATVFNTRLAAGSLPDLVDYRLDEIRLVEVYKQGHIIALNDLVDKYAPTVKKIMFVQDPYLLIANGDAEGHLLRFCRQTVNMQHRTRMLHINVAWLEKLGLPMPTTVDALYNALVAFNKNDMNKNGLNDEFATGYWVNYNMCLANAFGVKNMSTAKESFYPDASGKVQHTMLTPEARDYFAFMAKMAKAGVLDKEITVQAADKYNQKRNAYQIALFPDAFWGAPLMDSAVRNKGFVDAEYAQVIPPPAAAGVSATITIRGLPGYNGYMITKGCKYPDRITKMMDWAMTTEGSQQLYYGATTANPGEYYERKAVYKGYPVSDYVLLSTPKYQKEQAADPELRQKLGIQCMLFPYMLYGANVDICMDLENYSTAAGRSANFEYNYRTLETIGKAGIPGFAMVSPTAGQAAVLQDHTDLFLYIDEMAQKFSIGTESLDRWPEFLAACERQGIKDVLEVIQARYDAYLAVMKKKG